ncbi:hypothetical protein Gotur_016682, partial [Gossypium turneri]
TLSGLVSSNKGSCEWFKESFGCTIDAVLGASRIWVNSIDPDLRLALGLPIDGSPITGVSSFTDLAALCYQLLGDSSEDDESNLMSLKFTWLEAKFRQLSATSTEVELICAARAYIMHIIGGVLMPDANNNKVHLMYLPLLVDLSSVSSYNRGSAVLAVLYRELCQTTNPNVIDMGG